MNGCYAGVTSPLTSRCMLYALTVARDSSNLGKQPVMTQAGRLCNCRHQLLSAMDGTNHHMANPYVLHESVPNTPVSRLHMHTMQCVSVRMLCKPQ